MFTDCVFLWKIDVKEYLCKYTKQYLYSIIYIIGIIYSMIFRPLCYEVYIVSMCAVNRESNIQNML